MVGGRGCGSCGIVGLGWRGWGGRNRMVSRGFGIGIGGRGCEICVWFHAWCFYGGLEFVKERRIEGFVFEMNGRGHLLLLLHLLLVLLFVCACTHRWMDVRDMQSRMSLVGEQGWTNRQCKDEQIPLGSQRQGRRRIRSYTDSTENLPGGILYPFPWLRV